MTPFIFDGIFVSAGLGWRQNVQRRRCMKVYSAYREVNPLQPGYERRRDLYNLYHLLNHLNLFGSGYLPSVLNVLRRYGE